MNIQRLNQRNVTHFIRYYRLIAVAVAIAVAVIVGSLVVGDSVRTTLINRVSERLGDTETLIFSRHSFMAEELARKGAFGASAKGILLTNGFISQSGQLIPVFVWGTDHLSIPPGTVKINPSLAKELGMKEFVENSPVDIVLRLPATGLIPSGSLFVTENYTTSLRLSCNGVVTPAEGGNISLKNEQTLPFNIFVDRGELAETLELTGKINLILSPQHLPSADVEDVWNYTASGLTVTPDTDFTAITSDRVFLQSEVVQTITAQNPGSNRMFSYLANGIALGDTSIPYSFVTAIDRYQGEPLGKEEIILSDYSAKRLEAKTGDKIMVTYFTSRDLKTLVTKSVELQVKKIIPITELQADNTLSTEFPGLSDVERCTDWDSDLPIDMDLITDEDEKYWEDYRNIPKAIIAYDAVAADWSNAYGSATAIRVTGDAPNLSGLRAQMFGIQIVHPREAALHAAKNGVDFSGLFLALGFFIIISAMLLMLIPLSEMLHRRRQETALLGALGFTRKRIISMLWRETAPVVCVSSLAGVIVGLLYTTLIMWLLGSVWKGATHTGGFSVYPSLPTILIGLIVGIVLSLCLLRWSIARHLKKNRYGTAIKQPSLRRIKMWSVACTVITLGAIILNLLLLHSVPLFVVVGVLFIFTAALWGDYLICRNSSLTHNFPLLRGGRGCVMSRRRTPKTDNNTFSSSKLIWPSLYAGRKQALLSFFALAAGVFIVFSVGLNRRGFSDSSQLRTGTGGYTLWCESTVPIYHNMATPEGREKLSLTELPHGTEILQCLRLSADDASCLNLNKVSTPTVLGVDMEALQRSQFLPCKGEVPQRGGGGSLRENLTIPALIDETVLTWSLMKNLGDTLWYEGDSGQRVAIELVGTLPNTIFQGNILIDRADFAQIWRETTGSEVFLLKVDEAEKDQVQHLLTQALNEYGVRVTPTNERLRAFNSVTDTYLTIFLTLGGLGLLLGIMSFIIVVRKNLAMRREEISLYRTLGFTTTRIEEILYRENLLVPLYAIVTGIIGALLGVTISFMNATIEVWLLALFFALFLLTCVVVFIKKSVKKEVDEHIHR